MQPIKTPHDREVGRTHWTRHIVDAAATDVQNLCLLDDRQIVLTVDHRFALSHTALLSACLKNGSRASTRRSWRAATYSTSGVAGARLRPENLDSSGLKLISRPLSG